jgi:hypothetical protein
MSNPSAARKTRVDAKSRLSNPIRLSDELERTLNNLRAGEASFSGRLFQHLDWFIPNVANESLMCGRLFVLGCLVILPANIVLAYSLSAWLMISLPALLFLLLLRLGFVNGSGVEFVFLLGSFISVPALHYKYASMFPHLNLFESFNIVRSCNEEFRLCSFSVRLTLISERHMDRCAWSSNALGHPVEHRCIRIRMAPLLLLLRSHIR